MRRSFPAFWIFQFLVFTSMGLTSLFAPQLVVGLFRGERAPRELIKPRESLYEWVLALELAPRPDEDTRKFFQTQRDILVDEQLERTTTGSTIGRYTGRQNSNDKTSQEVFDTLWEAAQDWMLSCQPPPPPERAAEIQEWVHSIDEFPQPSLELCEWVIAQQSPQRPPKELQLMLIRGNQTLPISWRLAADQMRLTASGILAAALFTIFGLISPAIRRPLARSFVLMILFFTVALLRSTLGPPQWNLTHGVLIGGLILGIAMIGTALRAVPKVSTGWILWFVLGAWWASIVVQAAREPHGARGAVGQTSMIAIASIMALLGIVNARYWLIGRSEDLPQDNAGIAQRRPPQLWTLWLVQFVIVLTVGVGTIVFPSWTAELLMTDNFVYLTTDIVDDFVRILGASMIALALLSYLALAAVRDWIWQGIGWIFCIVFAVMALGFLFNAHASEYSIWGYLYGFQGLVYVPVTVMLLLKRDHWSRENVERLRWHWSWADFLFVSMLGVPLWHGRRPIYQHGVGARGRLRVLPNQVRREPESDGVPESEFFVPGREFPVEARFANFNQEDDASLDIRGCAIRFSCGAVSPLDLLFATGSFAPARSYLDFGRLLLRHRLRSRVLEHKVLREGLAAGMRRAPKSFASLSYYHQVVLEWQTPNAGHYLVRFRLVPQTDDGVSAQGLPDVEDLQHLWRQQRRTDETRDPDYLRRGLRDDLAGEKRISFQLEAQFHRPSCGDSLDWYDASLEWDESTHKWHPLAELVLDQPLNEAESEGLRIEPGNLPSPLTVPVPEREGDITDPRTLGAAQFRVAGGLGRLRIWRRPRPASLYSKDQAAPAEQSDWPDAAKS